MSKSHMQLYEGMYIISSTLSDEARQKALEKVQGGITERGGEVHKVHDQGRRRMMYDVSGHREGHYYVLYFSVAPSAITEMWRDYHLNEEFRTGDDVLTSADPTWYFRKPGGGPQYDVTVYALHNLTGILGPAKRVTAVSGLVLPEREFHGEKIACDMDDSTLILADFGNALFGFIYGTVAGSVTQGFQPNIYGTQGSVVGTCLNDEELKLADEHQPHVTGEHTSMPESHVFEDMMQLIDWIRDGKPSIANPEHARHVIDIFESGYRAAASGQTQELRTTFEPLPLEAL